MNKLVIGTLWVMCAASSACLLGCGGGKDPEPTEEPATGAESALLDCTDEVDGRPEGIPAQGPERYYPDVMKKLLDEDAVMGERFGEDEVTSCDSARKFMEIYAEEAERIDEEWREKNPPSLPQEGSAEDEEARPPTEAPEPPEDAASAGDTASEESALDIQKVANGWDWAFRPMLKISVAGELCTANIVSTRHIVTAAHCVPGSGTYLVRISQQTSSGAQPRPLFGGSTYITFLNNSRYLGGTDWGNDVSIGKTYYSSSKFADGDRMGIWLGGVYKGDINYLFGYGLTDPNATKAPGDFHWGTGKVAAFYSGGSFYRMDWDLLSWQSICDGDSGGATGTWHGGYFLMHGINASSQCSQYSYASTASRHADFIDQTVGTCIQLWGYDGYEMWC